MHLKYTVILLFFTSVLFAQSEDVLARKYSYSYTKYNIYGFFDVVRFAGLGAEYRSDNCFALDLKIGAIYPNGIFHTVVAANDFFSDKGIGIMLTPKLYVGIKKRFYAGFNTAFYAYGYKKKLEEKGIDPAAFSTNNDEIRDRQTTSFSFGPTLGWDINADNMNIGFFAGLGGELTINKITVYQSPVPYAYPSFPYTYHQEIGVINVLAGIKIGFGIKQEKVYTKRYYVKVFHSLISDENKFVLSKYRARVISRKKLQEYYVLKKDQIEAISKAYDTSQKDTIVLSNLIDLGYKNISAYVNYVYGKH